MNDVSSTVWVLTVVAIVALVAYDYFFHVRKAHTPTLREAAIWSAAYVGVALLFGIGVLVFGGTTMGTEYFAGYITEKALSVDNLFVFLVIIGSFKVPRANQQKVLLFGIVFALVSRTAFIFLGAALINAFSWVFYLFGLILLLTAGNMLRPENEDQKENFVVRAVRTFIPTSHGYDGDRMFTTEHGKRMMTPMLLVMLAIGGTDILFAVDSIPAIFGLTQNVYLVFTATVFSLLGLRQLYFLIDGLLDRLIYLSYGLSAILAFIGVKLVLHALHENTLPFINEGEPLHVVEIGTITSLVVIMGVLTLTVVVSLVSPAGRAQNTVNNARSRAEEYLDVDYESDPELREQNYARLLEEMRAIERLPQKYRERIRDEKSLLELLGRARRAHDTALGLHEPRDHGAGS